MSQVFHVKVPLDRVGVLIGRGGEVKAEIERRGGVSLVVDSSTGDVELSLSQGSSDVSKLLTVRNVVTAIGRGFSPEKAYTLLDEERLFEVWDLMKDVGMTLNDVKRVQGRIIGRDGKMRKTIEELTKVRVSVHGATVAIIGSQPGFEAARGAIQMLIDGRQHSTVYKYLSRERRKVKRMDLSLWEEGPG